MKQTYIYAAIPIVALALGAFYLFFQHGNSSKPDTSNAVETPVESASPEPVMDTKTMTEPKMTLDLKKSYSAVVHTTVGDITISFDTKNTPITSNNFISLAKDHFYDNTIFHRTIPGFMIQGGDPEGTGMGGPGYQFDDEYLKGSYNRGTVAMANSGPNTNGSQFFIMHADYPLPNAYVIFGHVTSGLDVVDKIATAPTKAGGEGSTPVNPIHITSIDIIEK